MRVRAAVTRSGGLELDEIDEPVPGSGHVLVRPLACGICGSDLHAAQDVDRFVELSRRAGMPNPLDPDQGVVFGHEFCAEIVAHGPDTSGDLPVGTRVCSVPTLLTPTGIEAVGYSNRYPGALSELMVLQEMLLLPVPDDVATGLAALTEPLAVGEHAVALADLQGGEVCLVVGCGPVGLAVIAALRARGHGPIVAADFSPKRRELAGAFGADEVIDPAVTSPYSRWADLGVPATMLDRAAQEMFGGSFNDAVVFEAVGAPGVLQTIVDGAPPKARIVVVGVCMQVDEIEPFFGAVKELELRFAFAYTAAEFAATLDRLARGVPGADALVTDVVDLAGAPAAFDALASPGEHGKVLVEHAAVTTARDASGTTGERTQA
jgi:threonine dehydrogenase-like Zn-dependent dehydrogenase